MIGNRSGPSIQFSLGYRFWRLWSGACCAVLWSRFQLASVIFGNPLVIPLVRAWSFGFAPVNFNSILRFTIHGSVVRSSRSGHGHGQWSVIDRHNTGSRKFTMVTTKSASVEGSLNSIRRIQVRHSLSYDFLGPGHRLSFG